MRKTNPNFGKCCYVDPSHLPNDIDNNPFNALSCHGVDSSSIQTRLVLVLDEETGSPVRYDIIPGNVLDINTIILVLKIDKKSGRNDREQIYNLNFDESDAEIEGIVCCFAQSGNNKL